MKTPREILLERHRAAEPKLDAVRREVVQTAFHREGRRVAVPEFRVAGAATLPMLIWRELVWPCRKIWAGLATVWVLILVANLSLCEQSPAVAMKSPPTSEMIMAWRQQQRLLTELIGPNETRTAEPPKPFLPQPSSERRFEILAA